MLKDALGNSVSTEDPAVLAAIDEFVLGFLRYETRAAKILSAKGCDCALANAYIAILYLFLESPEAEGLARPHLKRAQDLAGDITQRERFTLRYAEAWAKWDMQELMALGEEALQHFPEDLALLKFHQYHCFNYGEAPAMLRAAQAAQKAHPLVPQVHGMLAFGYEQCHWLIEAEAAARTALAMEKKEPWAQHALAHVMLTQGRIREGAEFLEKMQETWTDLNSFMLTHLWWHLALFYLSLGRFEEAMHIYDTQALSAEPSYSQDQVGAVSLLARLELAGLDVGMRWGPLSDLLVGRRHDVIQPFLSLQYLYGLAKAGKPEAATLLETIKTQSAPVWRDVAIPAAIALDAHAKGDWETAYTHMVTALPRMMEVGGSHAQRDLFEQILLDAAFQSERQVVAQQMLEARLANDPHGVPLLEKLRQVYAALGIEGVEKRF